MSDFEKEHTSDENWLNLTLEASRTYHFMGQEFLEIPNPKKIIVKKDKDFGHSHRVIDSRGICYYVKPDEGWYIRWVPRDEEEEAYQF
jgi:hypothetical protein